MNSFHDKPAHRNGLISKAGTKRRTSDDVPAFAAQYIPVLPANAGESTSSRRSSPSDDLWQFIVPRVRQAAAKFDTRVRGLRLKDVVNIPIALILIWFWVLWVGEEGGFNGSVQSCEWNNWEQWPSAATPHRVILVADPQLVDPHTYPGRPWPLSTLTVQYTDLYMRKAFQKISHFLVPDTIFFLGDLFDGGREWTNDQGPGLFPQSAAGHESDEEQWRKYGSDFWIKEYQRFARLFFDTWLRDQTSSPKRSPNRKMVVELPGNHDLGLGNGIRLPARNRFNAFFGAGNRVDVIGNHSFVSLDTVSLSAKGQDEFPAGTAGDAEEAHSRAVWEPVEEFLHNANALKRRMTDQYLRLQNGLPEYEPQDLDVFDLSDPRSRTISTQVGDHPDIPSIILSHIPLFRPPGTPCGPLRERWPPSKSPDTGKPLEKDERNAIPYAAGKQYQNVLTPIVTSEIVDLVGGVTHAFSGDDHDYCDVIHQDLPTKGARIHEITVKSISWAMGVRRPGFQMVSLWNPVDAQGRSKNSQSDGSTVQTHLCLLPDQLSTFIRYALMLALTFVLLTTHAVRSSNTPSPRRKQDAELGLLPMQRKVDGADSLRSGTHSSSSSSGQSISNGNLSTRSTGRPSRAPSPGYGIPLGDSSQTFIKDERNSWNEIDLNGSYDARKGRDGVRGYFGTVLGHLRFSMAQVALVVGCWYVYLLWTS